MYLVFMGVSGSGKSTFAKRAAQAFQIPFVEADDYHPTENIEKMTSGIALEDADRVVWLKALCAAMKSQGTQHVIASCSALNPFVRGILEQELREQPVYILLDVPKAELQARLEQRTDHYMPASLLESQINALEVPECAVRISNDKAEDQVFEEVRACVAQHLKSI